VARHRSTLRRRGPQVEPRPRILLVCEGEATERGYFEDMRREAHVRLIHLFVDRVHGVPKTLVRRAVELKRAAERDARRSGDINLRYDAVWCVFDVDEHPNMPEALQQAKDNGIKVAISNPCFELWLLLHFEDQRAFIDRAAAHAACRRHMPRYEKRVTYSELKAKYADAVKRAEHLNAWQTSRGCSGANPSTTVHSLTELIHALARTSYLVRLR